MPNYFTYEQMCKPRISIDFVINKLWQDKKKVPKFDTHMSPKDFEKYYKENIKDYPDPEHSRLPYLAMFRQDLLKTYFDIADPTYLTKVELDLEFTYYEATVMLLLIEQFKNKNKEVLEYIDQLNLIIKNN